MSKGIFTYFHPTSVEVKLQPTPCLPSPGLSAKLLISSPAERKKVIDLHTLLGFFNIQILPTKWKPNTHGRLLSVCIYVMKQKHRKVGLDWFLRKEDGTVAVGLCINSLSNRPSQEGDHQPTTLSHSAKGTAAPHWKLLQKEAETGSCCRKRLNQQWKKPGPILPPGGGARIKDRPWSLSPRNKSSLGHGTEVPQFYMLFW